ncbi:hypothetical protein HHK36_030920 [Tetracentron sinense]|uniref:TLC domain-containing protein n=1 Tax=Tetracentron sinense TaxID=13715 RepID=A0A834YA51_TETSI|nr:hypothetical protein HHK36_030920 [Tetracentron sinense]
MDSIWSRTGGPDVRDFFITIYFAFGFVGVRFFLDRFIYRRLAAWLLSSGAVPVKFSESKQGKIIKCSESMWKFTYYAAIEVCVLSIIYNEPWFRVTKDYLRGWPNQELKFSLKLYYMCECGFYIYSIVALLTWETRRKDFTIMMSHHVVTVILIGYSYITRYYFCECEQSIFEQTNNYMGTELSNIYIYIYIYIIFFFVFFIYTYAAILLFSPFYI